MHVLVPVDEVTKLGNMERLSALSCRGLFKLHLNLCACHQIDFGIYCCFPEADAVFDVDDDDDSASPQALITASFCQRRLRRFLALFLRVVVSLIRFQSSPGESFRFTTSSARVAQNAPAPPNMPPPAIALDDPLAPPCSCSPAAARGEK